MGSGSSGRKAKRARQKERSRAVRDARHSEAARRRRQRRIATVLTVLLIVGLGGGLTLSLLSGNEDERTPDASPTPDVLVAPTPEPVACDADLPKTAGARKRQYADAADQKLDPDKTYTLRLETSCGRIDIELATDKKPTTANSIAFLAREGFYDGLVFHRIVPGFVIQGGDPIGDGTGGAGYQVIEVPPADTKYTKGVVAMAKGANDPAGASGSQFFIVTGDDAGLPTDYAVLGRVVAGQDVAAKIEALAGGSAAAEEPPSAWAYIEKASVIEGG